MRGDGTRRSVFPITTVIGASIIAIGAAIDSTISFAIAEAAEDIEPESVRTLQALWDNDFIPFVLGSQILCSRWRSESSAAPHCRSGSAGSRCCSRSPP